MRDGRESLTERRRLRRRRSLVTFSALIVLFALLALVGLNSSIVRISQIDIYGADAALADSARLAMQGKYFGLVPRDSAFFFPVERIREELIAAHPEFAAISIFSEGLHGMSIKVHERVPIARWCGLTPTDFTAPGDTGHGSDEYCYVFDASGYIFAADASTTRKVNPFTLYDRLTGGTEEPLRASLAHADSLPTAFDFARQLGALGAPVAKIVIRGDEVDDLLESGTRVTYVLGHEQDAYTALVSAREGLNLVDGSLEYIDLRFDGKVYLKRNE